MKGRLRARINYNQFSAIFQRYIRGTSKKKKSGQVFQDAIHFHPSHLQQKMNETSFCALVGLLLTNSTIILTFHSIQMFFDHSK